MTARTIRGERIAYQIWGLIQRTGGDCTVKDMAEVTGESWHTCRTVCKNRGWTGLFRTETCGLTQNPYQRNHLMSKADEIEVFSLVMGDVG